MTLLATLTTAARSCPGSRHCFNDRGPGHAAKLDGALLTKAAGDRLHGTVRAGADPGGPGCQGA
jgi:hypothetical protein